MSTKDISKTPIEGGRTYHSKIKRRESSQHERRQVHTSICASHMDPDFFDNKFLPERKKVSKNFFDKLNPVERWMDKRIGKPWNKTYCLLKTKFDSRTTAGHHIVYDHIIQDVWISLDHSNKIVKYYRYYVDSYGVLRKTPSRCKENDDLINRLDAEKRRVEKWLDKRMIGKIGNILFWYCPTVRSHVENFDWWVGKYNTFYYSFSPRFVKNDRLNGNDIEFFTKLSPHHKETLLKFSKIISTCQCIHEARHHDVDGRCRIVNCNC